MIGHFAIQLRGRIHRRYEDGNAVAKEHTIEIAALCLILALSFVWSTFDPLLPLFSDAVHASLSCAILYTSLTGSVVIAFFARVRTIRALGSD